MRVVETRILISSFGLVIGYRAIKESGESYYFMEKGGDFIPVKEVDYHKLVEETESYKTEEQQYY